MLKNLANLIKVKTIVTLVIVFIYAVLAIRGDITPEQVQYMALLVVGFYFGTQHEKNNNK